MKLLSFFKPWRLVVAMEADRWQFLIGKGRWHEIQIAHFKSVAITESLLTNCHALTLHLQAFMRDFPRFSGQVMLVLPTSIIHVQRKTIPAIYSAPDVRQHLEVHLKRSMPGMQEKLVLDYQVLEAMNANEQQIAFVAMRASVMENLQKAFLKVGLKLNVIEADVYALLRLICARHLQELANDLHCLLYRTASRCLSIYFKNKDILFHQECPFELKQLNRTQQFFLNQQPSGLKKLFVISTPEITSADIASLAEIYQTTPSICDFKHEINLSPDYYAALGATLRGQT